MENSTWNFNLRPVYFFLIKLTSNLGHKVVILINPSCKHKLGVSFRRQVRIRTQEIVIASPIPNPLGLMIAKIKTTFLIISWHIWSLDTYILLAFSLLTYTTYNCWLIELVSCLLTRVFSHRNINITTWGSSNTENNFSIK